MLGLALLQKQEFSKGIKELEKVLKAPHGDVLACIDMAKVADLIMFVASMDSLYKEGMAHFVSLFANPGDAEYAPPVPEVETPCERKARIHRLRLEKGAAKAAEELEKFDPQNDPNATGDPYKTLFVARL